MAAERLNMDATELRIINMVHQDSVTITHQKLNNHTVSLNQVMERVLTEIDYANKVKNVFWQA